MGITKSQMRVWERSENVTNPLQHLGQTNKTLGIDQNRRNRAILEFDISTIFFWTLHKLLGFPLYFACVTENGPNYTEIMDIYE